MNTKHFTKKYLYYLKVTIIPTLIFFLSIVLFYKGNGLGILSGFLIIFYVLITPLYSIKIKNQLMFEKSLFDIRYIYINFQIQVIKLLTYLFIILSFSFITFLIGGAYYNTVPAKIFIGFMIFMCIFITFISHTFMSQASYYLIYDIVENKRITTPMGYISKSMSFINSEDYFYRTISNLMICIFMIFSVYLNKGFSCIFIPFVLNYNSNTNIFKSL